VVVITKERVVIPFFFLSGFWFVHIKVTCKSKSLWFAISSFHVYAVPVTVLLVGLPKNKTAKLRHLILLSRDDILSTSGDALRRGG
jgi:hypothetical protein